MQAQFIQLDPYANAFNEPASMDALARNSYSNLSRREVPMKEGGKAHLFFAVLPKDLRQNRLTN